MEVEHGPERKTMFLYKHGVNSTSMLVPESVYVLPLKLCAKGGRHR